MPRLSQMPITKTFTLECDPEATVTIRQATTNDLIFLADVFGKQTQIFRDNDESSEVRIEKTWNMEEIKRERSRLTLVGCNLEVEETGASWFTFRETPNGNMPGDPIKFKQAWGLLPPSYKEDIYKAVIKVNTDWNPAHQGE